MSTLPSPTEVTPPPRREQMADRASPDQINLLVAATEEDEKRMGPNDTALVMTNQDNMEDQEEEKKGVEENKDAAENNQAEDAGQPNSTFEGKNVAGNYFAAGRLRQAPDDEGYKALAWILGIGQAVLNIAMVLVRLNGEDLSTSAGQGNFACSVIIAVLVVSITLLLSISRRFNYSTWISLMWGVSIALWLTAAVDMAISWAPRIKARQTNSVEDVLADMGYDFISLLPVLLIVIMQQYTLYRRSREPPTDAFVMLGGELQHDPGTRALKLCMTVHYAGFFTVLGVFILVSRLGTSSEQSVLAVLSVIFYFLFLFSFFAQRLEEKHVLGWLCTGCLDGVRKCCLYPTGVWRWIWNKMCCCFHCISQDGCGCCCRCCGEGSSAGFQHLRITNFQVSAFFASIYFVVLIGQIGLSRGQLDYNGRNIIDGMSLVPILLVFLYIATTKCKTLSFKNERRRPYNKVPELEAAYAA